MKNIALLGMPNTGKSTFFNRFTGASARVGNWPGITIDLMAAKIPLAGHLVRVVDLPGIYDFHGFSEDEKVVRDFLENNPVDLLVIVLNGVQLERQLSLALQIKQLGLPAFLLLNMTDEAKRAGIRVDLDRLSTELGMPVAWISAKYGEGFTKATDLIAAALSLSQPSDPAKVREFLRADDEIEASLEQLMGQAVQIPKAMPAGLSVRLDKVLLHPLFGLPLFFFILFLLFQFIFTLGKPLQDGMAWVLEQVRTLGLEPALVKLPEWLQGLLLDGIYNGIGTVAAFVPVIILFFLVMTVVEDSGYLSRAAFLMDALMARMGLDGRSFVMLLMGFGCNVPALMGTRIMRSRALRLLTMLVIPFSLCSARLQVFLFLITAIFSSQAAPLVLFSLYLLSFGASLLTAVLFKKHFPSTDPFIIELPPYRLPTGRQILLRAWHEVRHFLKRATKFITAGVVAVWVLTHVPYDVPVASPQTLAGHISTFLAPALAPIGIDAQLAVVLIFGFVAKEIVIGSLAVIYGMEGDSLMGLMAQKLDWVQAYSFMLFTLVYTPCLSAVATLRNESKSSLYVWGSILWSLVLAWLTSFVFYQGARWLGF